MDSLIVLETIEVTTTDATTAHNVPVMKFCRFTIFLFVKESENIQGNEKVYELIEANRKTGFS